MEVVSKGEQWIVEIKSSYHELHFRFTEFKDAGDFIKTAMRHICEEKPAEATITISQEEKESAAGATQS